MGDDYRHVLVAALRHTPQVITGALYALRFGPHASAPVTELFIITTGEGAELAWRTLGGPEGAVSRLCKEYSSPGGIKFESKNIVVVRNAPSPDGSAGGPLPDVRTSDENRLLASQILGFVKRLTDEKTTAVHCLISGGRKPAAAYMMLALSLYGREQDRLIHVLVPQEFEDNPKFFFPPRKNTAIAVRRRGGEVDVAQTMDANVEVAEIPYVRLRPLLGRPFDRYDTLGEGVEEIIRLTQVEVDTLGASERLVIDLTGKDVRFGQVSLPLTAKRKALLAYFAERRARDCSGGAHTPEGKCAARLVRPHEIDVEVFLRLYERFYGKSRAQFEESADKLRRVRGLDADGLKSDISRINSAATAVAPEVTIVAEGVYGETKYGLALGARRIQIVE